MDVTLPHPIQKPPLNIKCKLHLCKAVTSDTNQLFEHKVWGIQLLHAPSYLQKHKDIFIIATGHIQQTGLLLIVLLYIHRLRTYI